MKIVMVRVIVEDPKLDNQQPKPKPLATFVVNYGIHAGRARVAKCAGWAMKSHFRMITEPEPLESSDETRQGDFAAQG
jgi:hypothetical protein